jgi:uncharacterized membrane protein
MTSSIAPVRRRQWLVPTGLILLSAVPVIAGGVRVGQLAGGATVTPDNARFFAMPIPVLLHIFGATTFCWLGALQFVPRLRRRPWHRYAGRVLVPSGVIAALSGMWMTLWYPLPAYDGPPLGPLGVMRLLFGSAMAAALVLGFLAVRRRDFARHRAWMMRGYAIGLGAGTQAFTHAAWTVIVGTPYTEGARIFLLGAGWVINLIVAEWVIRRAPKQGAGSTIRQNL